MGIAIFTDQPKSQATLVYYGIKNISRDRSASNKKDQYITRQILQKGREIINELIHYHQPDIVVQKKFFSVQEKNSTRLNKLSDAIKVLVKKKNLAYVEYASTITRKKICQNDKATKKDTIKVLISLYPELAVYLTPNKIWKDNYWDHMFDAVALGLCFWQNFEQPIDKKYASSI
jgi:Holliday junction resolvasome RuvABC endonuclease subunit